MNDFQLSKKLIVAIAQEIMYYIICYFAFNLRIKIVNHYNNDSKAIYSNLSGLSTAVFGPANKIENISY